MSTEIEPVADELFNKIRTRFSPVTLGDEKGNPTNDPKKSRFLNFNYSDLHGEKFGQVLISLINEKEITLTYNQDITAKMNDEQREEWFKFLRSISRFTKTRPGLRFTVRDIARAGLQIGDVKQQAKNDDTQGVDDVRLQESKFYGVPGRPRHSVGEHAGIKIRVLHSEAVSEEVRGARSRKIESIFLETPAGERFLCKYNNLPAARAHAMNLSQGGTMNDELAECINNMVYEMNAMRHFVRSTKNRQFEDRETDEMVRAAMHHYSTTKQQIHRFGNDKFRKQFLEDYLITVPEDADWDMSELKERFVKKVYDERFDAAFPIVAREWRKQQNSATTELEEWVNSITEDDGDSIVTDGDNKLRALQELCKAPISAGINGIDAQTDLQPIVNDLKGADDLMSSIAELSDPTTGRGPDGDVRALVKSWAQQFMPEWADQLMFGDKNVDDAHTNWQPQTSPQSAHPNDTYGATSLDEPVTDPNIPTAVQEDSLDFIRFLAGLKQNK